MKMKSAPTPDDLEDRELDAVVGGLRSQRDGDGSDGDDDDNSDDIPDSILWDFDGGN